MSVLEAVLWLGVNNLRSLVTGCQINKHVEFCSGYDRGIVGKKIVTTESKLQSSMIPNLSSYVLQINIVLARSKCSGVKASRCQSAPVSKCPCVKVSRCQTVPVSNCPGVKLSRCQTVPVSKSVPVSKCPGVKVSLCQSVLVSQSPSVPVSKCPGVKVSLCQSVLVSQSPSVPMAQCGFRNKSMKTSKERCHAKFLEGHNLSLLKGGWSELESGVKKMHMVIVIYR